MAARALWRQLSPHNAGCYPDAIHRIMQWMRWEARIDHNHVTVCFPCNICSRVSGYHLIKRATMEPALWRRAPRLESGEKNQKKKREKNTTTTTTLTTTAKTFPSKIMLLCDGSARREQKALKARLFNEGFQLIETHGH